jgi:uncharacterized protein (DUF2249 family)
MSHDCCSCSTAATAAEPFPFDARGVARRFRHAAVFGALDALRPGEAMRFMNDHDPLPLLGQLREYFGPRLDIAYVARQADAIVIDFRMVG